jgi:maltooligosyltrehalose synthase
MLRAKMGEETYIVAEKILSHDETLVKDWPIQGSSGYDFLAIVNNLFTYKDAIEPLNTFYNEYIGNSQSAEDTIYEKKKSILRQSFRGDWENISRYLHTSDIIEYNEKITPENMHEAIGEFLVNFPVYKVYSDQLPPEPEDALMVQNTIEQSVQKMPHLQAPLTMLGQIFLDNTSANDHHKKSALELFLKCMQYTGPLMAKGVEDTAMYTWSAFIVHNEVGDAIDSAGIDTREFHRLMIDRQTNYPLSVNTTATHDTKRGEDTRARLQVMSDLYPNGYTWLKSGLITALLTKHQLTAIRHRI